MFKDMYTYAVISRERLRRSGHPVPPMYYKEFSEDALIHAWIQDKNGAYKRRLEYALLAWRFHPSFRTLKFFARSWLKALRKRDSYAVQ